MIKKTALYPQHAALHARLVPFAGWEMPIYYTSILEEHQTVRQKVGVFDVSHLGHLEVSGTTCLAQLQPLFTQDLNKLAPGRALYSALLTEDGFILDEMILYRLPAIELGGSAKSFGGSEDRIRLVVNAANGDKVLQWLRGHLKGCHFESREAGREISTFKTKSLAPPLTGLEMTITDLRSRVGTLAVQGPKAVELVDGLAKASLRQVPRYSIHVNTVAGRQAFCARTGYTGEDGFELFLKTEDLEPVWKELLQTGRKFGIQPIGLGARDTLRLEAGLPLGGTDLDERTTPLEAGLEWTVSWEKGPFIGRQALERQRAQGLRRLLVGFKLKGPGIPRHGYPIFYQGAQTGQVTSGTLVPSYGTAIGMGYVDPSASRPGTEVEVEIRNQRCAADIVTLPFYRRKK